MQAIRGKERDGGQELLVSCLFHSGIGGGMGKERGHSLVVKN